MNQQDTCCSACKMGTEGNYYCQNNGCPCHSVADHTESLSKATVYHGFTSHPASESDKCYGCVKSKEAFDKAMSDGSLEKELNKHISNPEFVRKAAIEGAQDQNRMLLPTDIESVIEEFRTLYPLQVWNENNPDQAIFINPTLQKSHRDVLEKWLREKLTSLTTDTVAEAVEKAEFLFGTGNELDSLGYEFANAKTPEYQKEMLEALKSEAVKAERERILKSITSLAYDDYTNTEMPKRKVVRLEAIKEALTPLPDDSKKES